jgi:hypothetical protein
MDQDRVGAGAVVRLGAAERLLHGMAGDQRLHPRHDGEVVVELAVLGGADAAGELLHVGQGLCLADEGVGLREQLVLDAHAGDAALAQLAHEAAHVVEVAVAGVAVQQDGQVGGVRHVLDLLEHLGPGRLVVVAQAERRRHAQARPPDPFEARFRDDLGRHAAMRLHQEGHLGTLQHVAQAAEAGCGTIGGTGRRNGRAEPVGAPGGLGTPGSVSLQLRTSHRNVM